MQFWLLFPQKLFITNIQSLRVANQNAGFIVDKIQEANQNVGKNLMLAYSTFQLEDKAIEQLLEYYGGRYNPCEFIVVERQSLSACSPDWVK